MKFEQNILLSNTISSLFIIIQSIYKINLIFNLIRINHVFILCFITRRFIKTYMKNKVISKYFAYIGNGIILITLIILIVQLVIGMLFHFHDDFIKDMKIKDKIKFILYLILNISLDIQGFIYSIIIFVFGIKIIILLQSELKKETKISETSHINEDNNTNNKSKTTFIHNQDTTLNHNQYYSNYLYDNNKDNNHTYIKTRIYQIILLIISTFISYFVLLYIQIYFLIHYDNEISHFILFKSDSLYNHQLYIIYLIILLVPIFSYHTCFFILIIKSYSINIKVRNSDENDNSVLIISNFNSGFITKQNNRDQTNNSNSSFLSNGKYFMRNNSKVEDFLRESV